MKMAFKIIFKSGQKVIAEIDGMPKDMAHLTVEDVTRSLMDTEAYLERLTGLRVHIEQVL